MENYNIKEIPICSFPHNNFQLGLSSFILLGMFMSYLPQHIKIIKNRSSDGISPYFLLLGSTSAFCSLLNVLIFQKQVIQCCPYLTFGLCLESLLGILQIFSQWILFFIIFALYFVYFPEDRKIAPYIPHIHHGLPPSQISDEWKMSLWVKRTVLGHLIFSFLITIIFLSGGDNWEDGTLLWATFNGLFSMLLAMIQYFPQIYTTWKRKSTGALSIPMMLMQTPGAFLFVFSLASREGTNWTTWITYLVTGILQGCLLIICIYFQYLDRISKANAYEPIYIGIVQDSTQLNNRNRDGNGDDFYMDDGSYGGDEGEPLLLNNHNPKANYEYQTAPQQRTKSLLSKWKKGQAGSKLHLVHHSLASNLSERDDTLL